MRRTPGLQSICQLDGTTESENFCQCHWIYNLSTGEGEESHCLFHGNDTVRHCFIDVQKGSLSCSDQGLLGQ